LSTTSILQLQHHARELFSLSLTAEQLTLFDQFLDLLIDWNTRINLTAITEREAVVVRHFLDSLSVVKAVELKSGMRLIDVGTGAGFPGLPLHIVTPGLYTVLSDSTGKKLTFLDHVITQLGLQSIKTLHARAEEAGHISHHRASYDVVVARAVARLPILAEYLLPLARVGGVCIAMKGGTAFEEAKDAEAACKKLGGEVGKIIEIDLPEVADKHYLVCIHKTGKTPGQYPRKPGVPTRDPLK
jgi:16S rRNA (guanine527-N7)-methyltransferase